MTAVNCWLELAPNVCQAIMRTAMTIMPTIVILSPNLNIGHMSLHAPTLGPLKADENPNIEVF